MNKVDAIVKNHMLGAPSMFPDRMRVLAFIFCNAGGGYQWNADGTAGCIYGMPKATNTMNLKEPKEELARMDKADKEAQSEGVEPGRFSAYRRAELELEMLTLKHRAKNIDIYASENVAMKKWHPDQLLGAAFGSLQYSLVGTIPTNIDKDWAFAADELVTAAREALHRAKADSNPYLGHENLTKQLDAALDALEPITHRRESRARAALQLQGLWESLTPGR